MFEFRNLSPTDFENLSRDIIEARDGISFESFAPGRDMGIDFRFSSHSGDTILQAKHYEGSGFPKLKSACEKEAAKVRKLKPKRYILVTSVSLTPANKEALKKVYDGVPLANADIIGRQDIEAVLETSTEVLNRNFKLWLTSAAVLERILKSALVEQAETEIEEIKSLVPRFVHHGGVERAQQILEEHASLVVSGPPGIGKSTLARILMWLHMEQGWSLRVIHSIDEAFDALQVSEKQLIFFDDFLGQVRVTDDLLRGTDSRLPAFLARVKAKNNKRFILTTRDYIYRQAAVQSEQLRKLEAGRSNLILNVGAYTRLAKAEILFNHIYFSELPPDDIADLLEDEFYLKIIEHENFNPRLIEQITKLHSIRRGGEAIREAISSVLDNPSELWTTPYRSHFTDTDQALMIAMALSRRSNSQKGLRGIFDRLLVALEIGTPVQKRAHAFNTSLRKLEGTTLSITRGFVSFINPGVRDFMNGVIAGDSLIGPALKATWSLLELRQFWQIPLEAVEHREFADAWNASVRGALAAAEELDHFDLELVILVAGLSKEKTERDQLITDALAKFRLLTPGNVSPDGCKAVLDAVEKEGLEEELLSEILDALGTELERCMEEGFVDLTIAEAATLVEDTANHSLADERIYDNAMTVGEIVLDNVSQLLSDVSTMEELDELENEAENLFAIINSNWINLSSAFDEKRTELDERYNSDALYLDRNSSPAPKAPEGLSERVRIRSMFESLR
jgi:DNA polymerase III delta prime subunit